MVFLAGTRYTVRTCARADAAKGQRTPYPVEGRKDCFRNKAFAQEYQAITCYCKDNDCNNFTLSALTAEARKKVEGRSSSVAVSSLAVSACLLMTAVQQLLLLHRFV